MAKKVLVVEDNGNINEMIKKSLDSSYILVRARAVDEAIGYMEEEGDFDCFIIDLSILAFGLTLKEMADFQGREGYALLIKYLWKGKEKDEIELLKRKTIICSRYIDQFQKEFGNEIVGLNLIKKEYGFEKKIATIVNKICQ